MDAESSARLARAARQPFTWRGVAALAAASPGWCWAWCLVVAAGLGLAIERFVASAWLPVITEAVHNLPDSGGIRGGQLQWPAGTMSELARNRFLALRVNPHAAPAPTSAADISLEFLARELSAQSLFGYWSLRYPAELELPLNRPELEPLWNAWRPLIRGAVLAGGALLGLGSWWLTGLLLATPVRLLAALLRRAVTWRGCVRLIMAALLPGGLIVAGALLLYAGYGLRLWDFLGLCLFAHLVGPVLMLGAVWQLPHRIVSSPFAPTPETAPAEPEPGETSEKPGCPPDSPCAANEPAAEEENPFAPPRRVPPTTSQPSRRGPLEDPLNPS